MALEEIGGKKPKPSGWVPSLLKCLAEPPCPQTLSFLGTHTRLGDSPKNIPLCPQPGQGPCPLPGAAFSLHP